MKRFSILTSILLAFVAIPLQAGEAVVSSKEVAPIPPPLYGLGFYGAIDMGANVYQDRGGTKTFTNEFGDTLVVDPKNDVGFFGGIKAGYVFGTGVFRPTIEGDFFYNGFRGGANTTLTIDGVVVRNAGGTTFITPVRLWGTSSRDSRLEDSSRMSVRGWAFTLRNPLASTSLVLVVPLTGAEGKVIQTSPGRSLPAQITISRRSSARLLNTSSSIIRAPKSKPTRVAISGSS